MIPNRSRSLWPLAILILLAGCASAPPMQYLILTLPDAPETPREAPVRLTRVQVPDYLDNNRIWVRTGPNSLTPLAGARWAEPLPHAITRNLGRQLGASLSRTGDQPLLLVDIHRLEPQWSEKGDDKVVLAASWQLESLDAVSRPHSIRIEKPLPDRSPETIAHTLGLALAGFARELEAQLHDRFLDKY